MVWYRWVACALPFLLLQGPSLDGADAGPATADGAVTLDVRLDGIHERVVLWPHDLRAPAMRGDTPAPEGHLRGTLTGSGASVHLILRDSASLGIIGDETGTTWVHVVDGTLVPHPMDALFPEEGAGYEEDEVHAPDEAPAEGPGTAAANPHVDGVLQIAIERDEAFVARLGAAESNTYALDVMFLTEAIYISQFRIAFEVTSSWWWPDGDPYGTASGSALLRAIRDQWERGSYPTSTRDRELMHTFSGRENPGINGIAYIGQLETSWAYGMHKLRQDYVAAWRQGVPHPFEVITTAHEIGHNFDGRHEYAFPEPSGTADPLWQGQCVVSKYGTILFPCGAPGRVPRFSEATLGRPQLDQQDVVRDGGNGPRMRAFAEGRI